ncbi:hypothetical protein GCM10009678_90270 [Actinomadura kijaniata]
MADQGLPFWAIRLRDERTKRLWSQKKMARNLINAADAKTRAGLPSIESVQRYVRGYEAGNHMPGDLYAELYCRAFGLSHDALFGAPVRDRETASPRVPTLSDATALTSWLAASNTTQEAIDHLALTAARLAENHTRLPAAQVLGEVVQMHDQIQSLLRSGKQRLAQTRELFKIDSEILAHAGFLLGDLNRDQTAMVYGQAALTCAQEAESNEAIAWAVQSKTARWQGNYEDSATFARKGFEVSAPTPLRAMLASYEARAAGLIGDARRAREALRRADTAAEHLDSSDPGTSVWSFPPPRQALLALSVSTRTGDPDAALRAVAVADAAWTSGTPRTPSTWAQIRVGSGIAHLMKGDLDAALTEVSPMLALEPEFRVATVTRYLDDFAKRLKQKKYYKSPTVAAMLESIYDFNRGALLAKEKEKLGESTA